MKKSRSFFKIYVITTLNKPHNKYIFLNVAQYYQVDGRLHIIENGRTKQNEHIYNLTIVKEVHVKQMIEGEVYY